jgi:hypothetical protein
MAMLTLLFNQWIIVPPADQNNGCLIFVGVLDNRRAESEGGKGLNSEMGGSWCVSKH